MLGSCVPQIGIISPQKLQGSPPKVGPPNPLTWGTGQHRHLPRTTLPASAPKGVLLPASALSGSPVVQSIPGLGFPAPGPSSPTSLLAPLGPRAASAAGCCFSSAFASPPLLSSHSGEISLASFGICFPSSVSGAWGQHVGPGGSCSSAWAAAGASTGGVGLRLSPRVTSSSPGVSVSCT